MGFDSERRVVEEFMDWIVGSYFKISYVSLGVRLQYMYSLVKSTFAPHVLRQSQCDDHSSPFTQSGSSLWKKPRALFTGSTQHVSSNFYSTLHTRKSTICDYPFVPVV